MADPQTRTFSQIVAAMATRVQSEASGLVDTSEGSVPLAILEANALVATYLQAILIRGLALTRALTSEGADLDSWMADFNFYRLLATPAQGPAVFSRLASSGTAYVPVGGQVQTSDGLVTYSVVADPSNGAYDVVTNSYLLPPGVTTVTAPIRATTVGVAGNASVGVVSVITSPMTGVDSVSNALPLANGADAEKDPAFRTRFYQYLAGLSKATSAAITTAVEDLAPDASAQITQNINLDGSPRLGHFVAIVDDGSGAPSAAFLARATAAIESVRAFTITFEVHPPVLELANVSLGFTTAAGYNGAPVAAAVEAAVAAYLDTLQLGSGLTLNRLFQVGYDASPGVSKINSLMLNGAAVDLPSLPGQILRPGLITATPA